MITRMFIAFFALLFPLSATALIYSMPRPGNDIIGNVLTAYANYGETLTEIGERYGIGMHEMMEANPHIPGEEPLAGQEVIIPQQFILPRYRKGIVINLAELRLYYFLPDGRGVLTYPVGLGRKGWRTPTADTHIASKRTDPSWTVPKSIRNFIWQETGNWLPNVVPPGPENPLGPYALYLGKHGYLIHGTNQPWSIGKLISAGCIRLHNADVEELYHYVRAGTPVKIIHHPYKTGWANGRLYLEAHVPIKMSEPPSELNNASVMLSLKNTLQKKQALVDWDNVNRIVQAQKGIPEPIGGLYNPHSITHFSSYQQEFYP